VCAWPRAHRVPLQEDHDHHLPATSAREDLPVEVGVVFGEIDEVMVFTSVYAPGLTHKRETDWKKRTMLVAHTVHIRTTYRMAWEVITSREAVIWQYGKHEGFYRRLKRRARQ
jgi:hypothetical protein